MILLSGNDTFVSQQQHTRHAVVTGRRKVPVSARGQMQGLPKVHCHAAYLRHLQGRESGERVTEQHTARVV